MALSLVPITSQAYSFSAVNEDGVTIYYGIRSKEEKTCEVTYSEPNAQDYSGDISIPSHVNGYEVVGIGWGAFGYYNGLTSLSIPKTIKYINEYNFVFGDGSFQKVIIEDIAAWCSIKYDYSINPLVSAHHLYSDKDTEIKELVIPEGVTEISAQAFEGCLGLTSVTLPKSVTEADQSAFSGCSNIVDVIINCSCVPYCFSGLTSIRNVLLGNSVTSIGGFAFNGCTGLTSVDIPSSVINIGSSAFRNCSGLASVSIPNSVTSIGNEAFDGCIGLTSITIPNSVTIIGNNAFSSCTGLTSIAIPNSVTRIGSGAFEGCTKLTSITIPESVTNIGSGAFRNTAWLEDKPNGVVYAGKVAYSFKGELPNDKSIVLEDGTISIAEEAFSGLGITSLTLPNSVSIIDKRAFGGCKELQTATIPSSIRAIGIGAFANCTNLMTVYSEITDFFDIDKSVFSGSENTTLYVPKGMATTYRSSTGWSVIKYIEEMPDGTPEASFLISCNNKGSVSINGSPSITNKIAAADIDEGTDNTFTFTPKPGCRLDQVTLNGLDITTNVENNTLTCTIPANSQMIVTFTNEQGDINNDGRIDISDVVTIVNKILGIQ